MKVNQIMSQNVHTCRPSDTLADAAQLMWDIDCGCVPIVSEDGSNKVVGMLTDRDLCMATHFRGHAPRDVAIRDVMSTEVRSVQPSEDLTRAEAIMRDAQLRRLPVVDERQHLVGLLSLADLAREADRKRESQRPPITEDEVGDTLSAICTPRIPSQVAAIA